MAIGQLLDIGETINAACQLTLPCLACPPSLLLSDSSIWSNGVITLRRQQIFLLQALPLLIWTSLHQGSEGKDDAASVFCSNNDKQFSCILVNQFCQTFLLLFHHDKHILLYFFPKQTVISGECANLREGFCKIQPRPVFLSQIPKAGSLTRINQKFKKLFQKQIDLSYLSEQFSTTFPIAGGGFFLIVSPCNCVWAAPLLSFHFCKMVQRWRWRWAFVVIV